MRKLSLIEAAELRSTIIEKTEFTHLENGHCTRELQGHSTCINCLKELAHQHNLSVNKNNPGYWNITNEERRIITNCNYCEYHRSHPRFLIMQIEDNFYCIPETSFTDRIISKNSGFYFLDRQNGGYLYNDEAPYAT